MILPERLSKGDTIGIISPSRVLVTQEALDELNNSITLMEASGFRIKPGEYAFVNETGYGATAEHKAKDINAMFADPEVKAIFAITGGNNCNSTLDYIDFDVIKNNPKIFCGFSDITTLINVINQKTGLITFHGPNFKGIANGETEYRYKAVMQTLRDGNFSLAMEEDLPEFEVIKEGKAEGKLVGGNLQLISDLIFGKYKVDFKDKILVLEDLAFESPVELVSHNLYKLKQEGIFDEISGIWIGNYEGDLPFEKILLDTLDQDFNKPIIKSNNFGHCEKEILIPIGMMAEIDTSSSKPYIKTI